MKSNELTLAFLKRNFLKAVDKSELYLIFNELYEIYEAELIMKFNKVYKKIERIFASENFDELMKETFLYDYMLRICDFLYMKYRAMQTEYEYFCITHNMQHEAKMILYKTDEEFEKKLLKLKKIYDKNPVACFYIKEDYNKISRFVELWLLQSDFLLKLSSRKEKNQKKFYEDRLKVTTRKAEFAEKFLGKSLSEEKRNLYTSILEVQNELIDRFGPGHQSSLSESVRIHFKRNGMSILRKQS